MDDATNTPVPVYCKETVHPRGFTMARGFRCERKAVRDGYCKQHHPDAVAERRTKSNERYEADARARHAKTARAYDRPREYMEALRLIAAGHNDARTLATEVLAKWDDAPTKEARHEV